VGATAKQHQTHPKVMKKMVKKCSTGQSCIRKEVTSYKIHTLRALGRAENLGLPVLFGGHNLLPMVGIGTAVATGLQFNNQKHNAPFFTVKQDYIITVLLFLFVGTILSFHLSNRSIDLGTIHVFKEQI
jgi:hypothetical protein